MDRSHSSRKLNSNYSRPLTDKYEPQEPIHNSPRTIKYSSHNKQNTQNNISNKENYNPPKYNSLYSSGGSQQRENYHNRYRTDHQVDKRALKSYSEFSAQNYTNKENYRYIDKTPKPTTYHNDKTQSYVKREKVVSQDYDTREASPVMLAHASKPSKKMPSYKPMPKMSASSSSEYRNALRPCSTQDASPPPLGYSQTSEKEERKSNKIVLSKKQIKYSRNKQSLDLKADTQDKALNTYQPNITAIEPVSWE